MLTDERRAVAVGQTRQLRLSRVRGTNSLKLLEGRDLRRETPLKRLRELEGRGRPARLVGRRWRRVLEALVVKEKR